MKLRKIQAVIDEHIPSTQANSKSNPKTITKTLAKRKPKMMLSDRDVKIAQDIRDFILKELEQPMLSISELARKYNTNESKVKKLLPSYIISAFLGFILRKGSNGQLIYLRLVDYPFIKLQKSQVLKISPILQQHLKNIILKVHQFIENSIIKISNRGLNYYIFYSNNYISD